VDRYFLVRPLLLLCLGLLRFGCVFLNQLGQFSLKPVHFVGV